MATYNESDHPRDPKGKYANKNRVDDDGDLPDAFDDDAPSPAPEPRLPHVRVEASAYDRSMMALADGRLTLDDGSPIDPRAFRDSPYGRKAARTVLFDPSATRAMPAKTRKALARAAFMASSPYTRRKAIDESEQVRHFPADMVARSLRHRRDRDKALAVLDRVHEADRNASAAIIRKGFPNDRKGAFAFINRHKGRDGATGAAARYYLRVRYGNPKGSPDPKETRNLLRRFKALRDDPAGQAAAYWKLAYGDGTGKWPRGNAYRAAIVAFEGGMTTEGVQAFMDMAWGDERSSRTRRDRARGVTSPQTGRYMPKADRMASVRANLHALYPDVDADRRRREDARARAADPALARAYHESMREERDSYRR